ncbi:polymorphic toxin type 30 domain-containing protein [Paenibacillus sp. Leaf72]|uniref:polymorphic toxin type 30 domain-containing protein n=1 Tax=Paenibacillus sp. Leaf72 TaxID=1736234 RepID=UPI0009D65969|nr:polymorphic toxin type 30 domain-containing protein [Paenibacillus sp. Leaf72]
MMMKEKQAEETAADYKDLRFVWPYGKLRLEQLEIIHAFGEHGKLIVVGTVAEEKEDEIITHASANDHIGVYRVLKDGRKQPLFLGQLHHVELHAARDGVRVQLEVLSHTYDFDTRRKKRSFQSTDHTYNEIVWSIVREYGRGDVIDTAFGKKKTGKFLMQYEETDWEFLKRLASHVGAELVPDIAAHKQQFWIGIPDGKAPIELEGHPYEIKRELAPYLEREMNHESGGLEQHYTSYRFEWGKLLQLGDEVKHNHVTYFITKRHGCLKHGLLQWSYECALPEGLKKRKLHNLAIIGASINGSIIDVERNQVKLHLEMDSKQDAGEAQWFPYSAEGNQVLYMLPEKGAAVKLYFPSADEDEAIVTHAVRMKAEGAQQEKSHKTMADPGVKSFGNPQGKAFSLGDSELHMTAQEGALFISLNKYTGVMLNSSTAVQIQAAGSLNLSGGSIEVSGEESLYIQTATESIDLGEEVNVKGSEIELKASVTKTYERILSPFEQQVQEKGIKRVAAERMMENQLARGSGELKALKNEALELWDLAVDAADILINSDTVYEWVSGKEAAPLEERNDLMKGFLQAVDYGMETVTLQKSGGEIWSDITSAATSFVQPIVDMPTFNPMMFNPAFILVPKSMTLNPTELLFQTKEESEEIGQKTMEGYIRIVDAGTMVLGAAGATKSLAKGVGKGAKNGYTDGGDGPEGKKDKDGEGKPLLTDQMDEAAAAASKDGKLKTNASTLEKLLDELEKEGILVEKLRNAVLEMLPFRVVVKQTADGSRFWQMMSQAEYRQMTRMDGDGGGKHGPEGNKLGTGKVGDFSDIEGASIDEILSRIPTDAKRRELFPIEGKVMEGFEYKWVEDGQTIRVRVHGPDSSPDIPAGSNAANGWIVRIQKGKKYFDPVTGEYQPPGISNPASEFYNEDLINRTHIPIKSPD